MTNMNAAQVLAYLSVLLCFVLATGCSTDSPKVTDAQSPQQELDRAKSSVRAVFEFKKEVALQWNTRNTLHLPEAFFDPEIEEATRYHLMYVSGMGDAEKYAQKLDIVENEIMTTSEGVLVIPIIETAKLTVRSSSTPGETFESSYSDKFFFSFKKNEKGQWRITAIEMLFPGKPIETHYNKADVGDYVLTDSQLKDKAATDPQWKISYEEKKYFRKYFEGNIDLQQLETELDKLYREPEGKESRQPKLQQSSYNNRAAIWYALKYTSDDGNYSTASYNPIFTSFFGNDCANFVSQCLYAGGWRYEGSDPTSCIDWFYDRNNTKDITDDKCSQTWSTANGLYRYVLVCKRYGTERSFAQALAGKVNEGDLVFFDYEHSNRVKDHAMIVTKVVKGRRGNNVLLSGHSRNRRNYDMTNYRHMQDRMFFADL